MRSPRRWRQLLGLLVASGALTASGCRRAEPPPAVVEEAVPSGTVVSGETLYAAHCAVCHMPDGYGVPNMQPSLVGSPVVQGDAAQLEQVIRGGSAVLATRRPNPVSTEMPPFGYLADDEIKALVTYVQQTFGG